MTLKSFFYSLFFLGTLIIVTALLTPSTAEATISEEKFELIITLFSAQQEVTPTQKQFLRDLLVDGVVPIAPTQQQFSVSRSESLEKKNGLIYKNVRYDHSDGSYREEVYEFGNLVTKVSVPARIATATPIQFTCSGYAYYNRPAYFFSQTYTSLNQVPKECPNPERSDASPVHKYPDLLNRVPEINPGATGPIVADLQRFLNEYNNTNLAIDSSWGSATTAGLKKFQREAQHADENGVLDLKTRNEIYLYVDKKLKDQKLSTSNAHYVAGNLKYMTYPGESFTFGYPNNTEVNIQPTKGVDNDLYVNSIDQGIPYNSKLRFSISIDERSWQSCDRDFEKEIEEQSYNKLVKSEIKSSRALIIYYSPQADHIYRGCINSGEKNYFVEITSQFNPQQARDIAESFKI